MCFLGGARGVALLAVALGVSCSKGREERAAAPAAAPAGYGTFTVIPENGAGRAQTFVVTLSRVDGAALPAMIGLLVTAGDGSNACYAFHALAAQETLLVNDSGEGSKSAGTSGIANQQCEVAPASSDVAPAAVTVRFPMKFRPEFRGVKTVRVIAQDDAGKGPGLQTAGRFTVE